VVWFAATGRAYLQLGTLHRPLIQFVIVIFLITTSACHHAVRTISSLFTVLGARGGVIVGTHPLVSTPSGSTKPTSDLARYCLLEMSTEFTQ